MATTTFIFVVIGVTTATAYLFKIIEYIDTPPKKRPTR